MKHRTVIIALLLLMAFCACKKSSVSDSDLVGQWSVVNDTTYLEGTAIFQGGSQNYIGVAGDYFKFTQDGNLYIKEGSTLDTAAYSFVASNKIKLVFFTVGSTSFGPNGATRGDFIISNFTRHSLTLTLAGIITPDGAESEQINLRR
jgi:hypothetical protein